MRFIVHRLELVALGGLPHEALGDEGPHPVGLQGDEPRAGRQRLGDEQRGVAAQRAHLQRQIRRPLPHQPLQQRALLQPHERHPVLQPQPHTCCVDTRLIAFNR